MDDGLDSKTIGLGMAWALSHGGAVLEKNKLPLVIGVWLFFVREVLVQRGHR